MAATRALTVCDTYDRFVKGKKVDEAEWDYTIIPQNATELKNKYKLDFGKTFIPEDNKTKNDLFQAGLEMLVNTGFYNMDLKKVMHVTEEEVWEGIKKTPTKLILGEGRGIASTPGTETALSSPSSREDLPDPPSPRTSSSRSCSPTPRRVSSTTSWTEL